LKDTLAEERERKHEMRQMYLDEISELPKGSLVVQTIGGNDYCYLKYRLGDKVISSYIGKACDHQMELEKKIARRRRLEQALRRIKEDLRIIDRAIGK